jgi:hypothetical protein
MPYFALRASSRQAPGGAQGSLPVVVLVVTIAKLATIAASFGLFYDRVRGSVLPTSVEEAAMKMYGHGIYRYDSLLVGAGFRGVDAVTLFLGVPLLVISAVWYRRGSFRGALLLAGTLAYFLYNYASMALSAAYNDLFLVYVALFSTSLFAFILVLMSFDLASLPSRFSPALPRREIAAYLAAVGFLLVVPWLGDVVAALVRDSVPVALGSYTTIVTYVLDLVVIVPAAFVAAVLLVQSKPLGYLLAATLLTMNLTLGAALLSQGIAILFAGVRMSLPQIAGMIGSFAVLGLVGARLMFVLLHSVVYREERQADLDRAA